MSSLLARRTNICWLLAEGIPKCPTLLCDTSPFPVSPQKLLHRHSNSRELVSQASLTVMGLLPSLTPNPAWNPWSGEIHHLTCGVFVLSTFFLSQICKVEEKEVMKAQKVDGSDQPGGFLSVKHPWDQTSQRHWIMQRSGDWRFPLFYEMFRRSSEVHLLPDSVIWKLFISFFLPQGFDTNQGSVDSCGLFIPKCFLPHQ